MKRKSSSPLIESNLTSYIKYTYSLSLSLLVLHLLFFLTRVVPINQLYLYPPPIRAMSPPKKSIAIKAKNDISVYASPDRHVINEAAASAAAVVVDGEQVAGGESVGNNEPRPAAASRIIKLKRGQNPPSRDGKRDDADEEVGTTEATSSMDAEESFVTGATDSSVGVELLKTDENNNNQAGSSSSSSTAMEEGDNVVNKVVSNEGEGGGESCNLIDEKENGSTIEDEEQEVDHPTDDLLNSKDDNDDNTVDDEDKASMKEKKKAASHGAHPPAMNLYPGKFFVRYFVFIHIMYSYSLTTHAHIPSFCSLINQYQYTVLQKYTQNKQLLQDIIIHMQQQHIMHTIISIVLHNNNMVVMLIHTMQLGMQRNNNMLRHTIIINNSVLHHVMMMGTRKPH